MKSKYKHIFEPFTIKHMTVKNRIVMTPMGTNYGEQNGEMSFLHINYYEQRAKGGTGLLIVENASVDSPQGSNGTTQLRIDQDNYIPRLFKLCETVHKHGSCIAIQINHAGASAQSARINMQPVSASDVPSKAGGEIPRPLEKDEIMHIVKKYGEAAKRAQIAGFDAVEIHAGHSYLISQFFHLLQIREQTNSADLWKTVQDLQNLLLKKLEDRLDHSSLSLFVSVRMNLWKAEILWMTVLITCSTSRKKLTYSTYLPV